MLDDIRIEYYILFFFAGLCLLSVALLGKRKSPSAMRKLFAEYEELTDECNYFIKKISDNIERLSGRIFVSVSDEQRALELVDNYKVLYQEIFLCNDRIGIALSKRKIKQYKKLKEQAYTILRRFQKVLDDLDDIARYTQSKDEWEYWQRVREAEDYYRKHGRFYYEEAETTKENKSDASNKKDHQERNRQSATSKPLQANADIFFGDCDNIEALEKKYRSLAKKYHPDMPTGDKDTFQKMLAEYERKKKSL